MRDGMIFTSESVTPGHPDKLCDRISDAAVDAFLHQDPRARAVVECAVATGIVFIAARFAADAVVDLPSLARGVIAEAGYVGEGFDARTCSILTSISELPAEERAPHEHDADEEHELEALSATEQANVFGYATDETEQLMPAPLVIAHRLARALDTARGALTWLAPDGKTQAGVLYGAGGAAELASVALTVATMPGAPRAAVLADALREQVVVPALAGAPLGLTARTELHVNAGGPFAVGGPARHAGLTGRKNGIDTYGEAARQSGAALSGKDPSRIDRIGAYAARHAAKCVVAAGLARRCEVHLGYVIGHARPVSVAVECFGTATIAEEEIARRIAETFDFRPAAIERRFALRARAHAADAGGFFRPLAVYGQMGREDLGVPWEDTAEAALLR
ncbi:methionine adenosyltransferase [Roseomonas eburnea]|uniref:Methionine adenosyltransferase n=1 Tax=Neoroseomonas eburnea TaxID=1346889 RepID=A0A9X9XH47_9PROT|nr:methionine adenosyltransferase [Neoroseomonas eburnea]MBR0683033.1 methionine adenosyltransferase [Neoroseomonas eburnea]